ncbi:MAG: glycosyltransferase [Candidatus Saganbacteria bacterium]|nr:glycosyltransferase [Candidatus Saganbacteria bacterium]
MRLAIVHDFLVQFGGAERCVAALHELYPEAPVYTALYDESRLPETFRLMDIRTSFLQRLPLPARWFKAYFMLYPLAFERFDLAEYDVILSSSSSYAKGIRTRPGQLHICYCYTPPRFLWRYENYMEKEAGLAGWFKRVLPFLLEPVRQWDLATGRRVDHFIAISREVAGRIREIYGRKSDIIYPPVETEFFRPAPVDRDYYLIVSRLNHYKRIDLAVAAFNRLGLPLKIIGDGPARRPLERQARANIEFLGRRPDAEVGRALAECRALIFPGEEDFGIVPLEAGAAGRPVIAYRAGGAKETVVDGVTGLFFDEPTPAALLAAVERFKFAVFDKNKIRQHARLFDKSVFLKKIGDFVKEKYGEKSARA